MTRRCTLYALLGCITVGQQQSGIIHSKVTVADITFTFTATLPNLQVRFPRALEVACDPPVPWLVGNVVCFASAREQGATWSVSKAYWTMKYDCVGHLQYTLNVLNALQSVQKYEVLVHSVHVPT